LQLSTELDTGFAPRRVFDFNRSKHFVLLAVVGLLIPEEDACFASIFGVIARQLVIKLFFLFLPLFLFQSLSLLFLVFQTGISQLEVALIVIFYN
jgi:hypothetical protein